MDVGCRKVCLCNITSGLKSDRVVTIDREYQRSAVHCVHMPELYHYRQGISKERCPLCATSQNCNTVDREYQRSVAYCVPHARTA